MLWVNVTSLGSTHMEQSIPESARTLILNVVQARQAGRAQPLTMSEAALLREHELIDHVSRPTSRGFAVAEEFLKPLRDERHS